MRTRPLILLSLAVTAALVVVALAALARLPAAANLPVHWNAAGEADGFAPARVALFAPAVAVVLLSASFVVLPRIEPLQHRLDASAPLAETCWVSLLALALLIQAMVAAPAFGIALPATVSLMGMGALLCVVGNALPKSRPGFYVGIRTPWALVDADNWIATHRLGARTMMAGGAAIVLAGLLPLSASVRGAIVVLALAGAVLPPLAYSWWHWRRRWQAGKG